MATCDYEAIRLKNIEQNKKFLAELGFNPYKPLGRVIKKSVKRKRVSSPQKLSKAKCVDGQDDDLENYGSIKGSRRRSSRLKGREALTKKEIQDEVALDEEDENAARKRVKPNRPNFYGAVEGVEVGTVWETRMECCHAGVHRPPVCGIHGGLEGAYSIALSGGYEDNIDLGECFTYTGEGGRDLRGTKSNPKNLRTAPQSKDQSLDRGNLALHTSVTTEEPVRVIRGYKLQSPFAPDYGYRYDGLFRVEKAWYCAGAAGFGVWKFALKRLPDQAPPPWELMDDSRSESQDSGIESNLSSGRTSPAETDSTEQGGEDLVITAEESAAVHD